LPSLAARVEAIGSASGNQTTVLAAPIGCRHSGSKRRLINEEDTWMRILALIGVLGIVVAVAAAVFFFGGYYNIAATQQDTGPVAWALIQVRTASISRHATDTPPGTLNDAATVQAGAKAFAARGCVNCHGGPGVTWAKFSEGLNPSPPDLKEVVGGLAPNELFWVVKNGIKMTGMPSFGATGVPDQEIWSIVAFLKKLPTVSDTDFKAWTAGS
jgi:mono/diheme cytochrome c family protein